MGALPALRVGLLIFCLGTAVVELIRFGLFMHLPGYSDVGASYYVMASMGWHHGWNTLYDQAIAIREWQALGGETVLPLLPTIYPPPMIWLASPFALLPFIPAIWIWIFLVLGLFVRIWQVLVQGSRLHRWTLLAAALGVFPVAFALMLGNAVIVVAGAVTGCWGLLTRRREVAAGLVLILIIIKPQVAFLVPFALLAAGYRRTFLVWAAGSSLVAGLAIASIGAEGMHEWAGRLQAAAQGQPVYLVNTAMTLAGVLGHGWLGRIGQGVMTAVTLLAAYRRRRDGPELPIVAGILGSVLVTPYIHAEDLVMSVVAVWLYWRTRPPVLGRSLVKVGYLLLLPTVVFRYELGLEPVLVLLEVALVLTIGWPSMGLFEVKRAEPETAAA